MYISIQEYSLYTEGKCRRLHINPFTHLLSQVLVQSFIHLLSRSQLQATNCKIQKQHQGLPALSASHLFQPVEMETLDSFNPSALEFLSELGHRMSLIGVTDVRPPFLTSVRLFISNAIT